MQILQERVQPFMAQIYKSDALLLAPALSQLVEPSDAGPVVWVPSVEQNPNLQPALEQWSAEAFHADVIREIFNAKQRAVRDQKTNLRTADVPVMGLFPTLPEDVATATLMHASLGQLVSSHSRGLEGVWTSAARALPLDWRTEYRNGRQIRQMRKVLGQVIKHAE